MAERDGACGWRCSGLRDDDVMGCNVRGRSFIFRNAYIYLASCCLFEGAATFPLPPQTYKENEDGYVVILAGENEDVSQPVVLSVVEMERRKFSIVIRKNHAWKNS